MENSKILVVDDDAKLRDLLVRYLGQQGYTVDTLPDARELQRKLARNRPDLMVLDVMMPGEDGLAVVRRLRAQGEMVPVIMLTARGEDIDRILGLEMGADDYLPKPFSLEELLARMRSLLRRQSTVKKTVLDHGDLKLDLLARTLHVAGQPIELTSREFALLEVFMQSPGRILPRTLICEKIWESAYDIDTNLLDVYMSKLRAKLETTTGKPVFKTVRGVGYRLI